jgi:hypothetical protein
MKRRICAGVALGLTVCLSVALGSCVVLGTFMGAPTTSKMDKKDLGDPSTHAVLFGAISDGFNASFAASDIHYLQMNTVVPAKFLASSAGMYLTKSGIYYSNPVPAGGSYKLTKAVFRRQVYQGTEYMNLYFGLSGRAPWDLLSVNPGLNYFGTWLYSDKEESEAKSIRRYEKNADLRRRSSPSELECLQEMLPVFKNTSWQPVIEARIKELSR